MYIGSVIDKIRVFEIDRKASAKQFLFIMLQNI